MATSVRSFSKINLGLAVGPARPDGFHGLMTCYQTLALHDVLTVSAEVGPSTEITIRSGHPGVPCTVAGNAQKNTAYRMVEGALERLRIKAKVRIELEKRLPVQGGLGAGSANAAAALIALERELGTTLPGPERLALAAEVGSDVPLFLVGGAVLGVNRGEQVFPLPDGTPLSVVVAVPSVGVSTAQAFRDLDARMQATALTGNASSSRLEQLSRVLTSVWTHTGNRQETTGIATPMKGDDLAENPLLALVHAGVENDFESVAFRQHPSLQEIKRALKDSSDNGSGDAVYAALSGSGSALFGIYRSRQAASEAQQRVQNLNCRAFLTETLPRSEYWQWMFA